MDMLEFLRTRRTYRRFEQRPVAPEILTEAVDAARIASCGANRQTVRYIVVQSADAVAAVQPLVHWAAYLPPEQGQPKPDELPTAFIAVLQDALNALGYSTNTLDGIFGHATENALKACQRRFGLTADGVCGCASWKKIAEATVGIGKTATVIDS